MNNTLKWEKRGDEYRASDGHGAFIVKYAHKAKRWFLYRDKFGSPLDVLGHYRSKNSAMLGTGYAIAPGTDRMKNPKPKKGVMPPALKKYWAARRKREKHSLIPMNKFAPKRASATPLARKRRKNPVDTFRLAIRRGKDTLFYTGDKFVKVGKFKRYASAAAAKNAAQLLAKNYRSLKGWSFYAIP